MPGKPVTLKVDDIDIAGQLILPPGANDAPYPAVCLCHGIPSGTADPGDPGYAGLAARMSSEGFAAFFFNFRGARTSGGNFDILGWTRDLRAVIDYLWSLPEIDKSQLALVGFSAGAAVSIHVAADDKRISAVASCASPAEFSAIIDPANTLASLQYFRKIGIIRDPGFPSSVADWLNGFRLVSPLNSISGISPRPLLVLQGRRDTSVPLDHAQRLYELAGEPKQLIILDDASHRLRQDEGAVSLLIDWLQKHNRR